MNIDNVRRYYDLNSHLREIYGCRVQKITLDAGLTCPNRDGTLSRGGCIYCNARGSGTGAYAAGRSITQQLEQGKEKLARRYKAKKYIAYFQSFSNTYAPPAVLGRLYAEALSVSDVVGLSIGTRPDCVDTPVLDLLQEIAADHPVWVEYGLQSAHDSTLQRINRGHDAACFHKAVVMTRQRGISVCAHVILGLPGESRRHMRETARFLAALGIDGLKIHLLYVVAETPMAAMYRSGRYQCLTRAEYISLVVDFLERIPAGVVIQRLTGDPHPQELVAPKWALQKAGTLQKIKEALERRNTWQGKRCADDARADVRLS